MSKTEILRQSAAVSNERRVERLANQIELRRQADRQSVEEWAGTLEPLGEEPAAQTGSATRQRPGSESHYQPPRPNSPTGSTPSTASANKSTPTTITNPG